MIQPNGRNPLNDLACMRASLHKEGEYLVSRSKWRRNVNEEKEQACFKIPMLGDQVKVTGMSRRPQLNGSVGEIVSSGADDEGFFVVRLLDGNPNGPRKMKVRPNRLAPLEPRSVELVGETQRGALDSSEWRHRSTPTLRGGFEPAADRPSTGSAATLRSSSRSASFYSYHSSRSGLNSSTRGMLANAAPL